MPPAVPAWATSAGIRRPTAQLWPRSPSWWTAAIPPRTVYFLFQNAEETGDGAKRCLALLEREPVEAVYGFHNMPGYPLHAVCLRPGPIHCASRGMTIRLTGVSTHASTPELGRSPALAVARLVEALPGLTDPPPTGGWSWPR